MLLRILDPAELTEDWNKCLVCGEAADRRQPDPGGTQGTQGIVPD